MLVTTSLQINQIPLSNTPLLSFFRLLFIAGSVLYLLFAIVIIRQIHVMRHTLITSVSPVIKTLGFIHFIVALGVCGLFLLIL